MKRAELEVIFLKFTNEPLFDEFGINNKSYSIENGKINIYIEFNDLELELGKKVCKCELISKKFKNTKPYQAYIELYLGFNFAYCFIDSINGVTLELAFYSPKNNIDDFVKKKLEISHGKNFDISLFSHNTQKQANVLLINMFNSDEIEIKEDNNKINIQTLINSIENFTHENSYKFCFFTNNFDNFVYKKVEMLEELNFKKIYEENNNKVDLIFDKMNENMDYEIKDINLYMNIMNINEIIEENILRKKYIYPKNILIKEINEEKYIEFIYKIILITIVYEKCKKIQKYDKKKEISIKELRQIHIKLLRNKMNICLDKNLEIYEKVFLLMFFYHNLNYEEQKECNYLIKYLHVDKIAENSPLKLSLKFLDEFIDNLDYDSPFFYPLLSIDGGMYSYKYTSKEGKKSLHVNTYGIDMYSLEIIKNHLKNLIPNIIVIEDDGDADAQTNCLIGILSIDIKELLKYGIKDIDKKNENNRHHGFILSRLLLHELYGHKKSGFSKNWDIENSPNFFKDLEQNIRFLSRSFEIDIYKYIDDIDIDQKIEDKIDGDSGYFIEYYFGSIYGQYTTELIDKLYDKGVDFSILFDLTLWHRKIDILNEYVKYLFFIKGKYMNSDTKINLNFNLNISEQIKEMRSIIIKNENTDNIEEIIKNYYISLEPNKFNLSKNNSEYKKNNYPAIKKRFFKV